MSDPDYVQAHGELLALHDLKSAGYGTGDDPLANFTAVAAAEGLPAWQYPRMRALEKLARIVSLERQGRLDALEEEHLDVASLMICAEALRRRTVARAPRPDFATDLLGRLSPSSRALHPSPAPPGSARGRKHSYVPLSAEEANARLHTRLRELALTVEAFGLGEAASAFHDDPDARAAEIVHALRLCSDLIGPTGPRVAPRGRPKARRVAVVAGRRARARLWGALRTAAERALRVGVAS